MDPVSTVIITSVEESIVKPIAKFGLNKLKEMFQKEGSVDVNLDDVLKSRGGQEAVRIGLDFIKRNNGIPNEKVYKVLKAILFKLMTTHELEPDFDKFQYYAEVVKTLSTEELHVLIIAFKISLILKKNNQLPSNHVDLWVKAIVDNSTIVHEDIVYRVLPSLLEKRLVDYFAGGVNVAGGVFHTQLASGHNCLSELGYSMLDLVYRDIKDCI